MTKTAVRKDGLPAGPEDAVSKNARLVVDNWSVGQAYRETESCWTDGTDIYSYANPILVWMPGSKLTRVVLNKTGYSIYSAPYQIEVGRLAKARFPSFTYTEIIDVATGTPADQIRQRFIGDKVPAVAAADEPVSFAPEPPKPEPLPKVAKEKSKHLYSFNPELGF
jgi:hypothetical protein